MGVDAREQEQVVDHPAHAVDLVEPALQRLAPLVVAACDHGRVGPGARRRADPGVLRADEPHLERALRNVIKNALEHSAQGDTVRVDVAAVGGDVVVRVADAGPGIPSDALPHVFDRFYRVDESRSRDSGGSGLGLAIARWIVEQHQGSIVAQSGDGQGTAIVISLPAA